MKPYILDLRQEACPMALLRAKRSSVQEGWQTLVIFVTDTASKQDIIRFFKLKNFTVQVEEGVSYSTLTVNR